MGIFPGELKVFCHPLEDAGGVQECMEGCQLSLAGPRRCSVLARPGTSSALIPWRSVALTTRARGSSIYCACLKSPGPQQ